ncbi:hypothetical protein ACGFZU_42805 [Streptomyces tendae]|uniref:hypothetical protein n=1 Tax=Streptomyces tendae TaxID=1932 RepID=UPI003721CCD2
MTPAAPSRIARPRALEPYENWRPPIIGVSVLAPVGATSLILPCIFGDIPLLPTGAVEEGQKKRPHKQYSLVCPAACPFGAESPWTRCR